MLGSKWEPDLRRMKEAWNVPQSRSNLLMQCFLLVPKSQTPLCKCFPSYKANLNPTSCDTVPTLSREMWSHQHPENLLFIKGPNTQMPREAGQVA